MKKKYLIIPLVIWLTLACVELIGTHFVSQKVIYWRAWELVSNYTGKDSSYVPFKPNMIYSGKSYGDLLNGLNLKARAEEIRNQYFEVDEYGFRNRKGFLNEPVEAVITGSSYVGGAQETQTKLVSEILTKQYNIRTYNYAVIRMKHFWEDRRFIQKPPKYLILLGAEGEFVTAHYKAEIEDNDINISVPKWNSTLEWEKKNQAAKRDFLTIQSKLLNFSFVRYIANFMNTEFINWGKTRSQVASDFPESPVKYDKASDSLYYNPEFDNPILGEGENTVKNINIEIKTLMKSKDLLKKRGITLIVAAMPSKTSLQHSKYANVERNKTVLVKFEEEMEKNGIEHIKLFDITRDYVKKNNKYLYYKDDSHWNSKANEIITRILAEKITELNKPEQMKTN